MATPLTARLAPRPDVIFRTVGTEAILLNLEGGLYFGLDDVGTRIWTLLANHDGEGVSRQLTDEFDVTLDQARADVGSLIDQLVGRGLLAPIDEPR